MPPPVDFSLNETFLRSTAGRPKLRVGVLIDGCQLRAYARRVLDDIAASDFAEVICYISNAAVSPPAAEPRSTPFPALRLFGRLREPAWRRGLAYSIYERWYAGRRSPAPDPLAPVDCSELMARSNVLFVVPTMTGFVDRLEPADVERVRAFDLDVLLRFGFRIVRGDILRVARHGIWSFHHGDSARYRGGPAHLWELVERNPVSGVVLQQITEELDAGRVLARGLFATAPSLSVAENRYGPYWSSQHFVIRTLHELHQHGTIRRAPDPESAYAGRRKIYRRPTNLEVSGWLASELGRRGAAYVRRSLPRRGPELRRRPQWRIALRSAEDPLYARSDATSLDGFRWLRTPAGRFWADPFLLDHGNESWLFFEEFDEATGKGHIAGLRIEDDGSAGPSQVVVARPYHLSYPHVFEHDGEVFMVPESQEAGRIDLLRARRFPDDWVQETTLLPLRAVDNTVFEHDGEWWMLASPRVVAGHAALTYVWRAPRLTGPWRLASHVPLNDDVRSARGAGRVFRHEGSLWRPSQDCSVHYGRALGFSSILQLGEAPRERPVRVVQAQGVRGLVGIHTYNRSHRWEVIDGFFNG